MTHLVFSSFQMEPWVVNPLRNELVCDNQVYVIESKPMQVLCYLYQRANEIVSIDELVEEVWGGKSVGNHAVYRVINQLRKFLGYHLASKNWIKTIPRQGYQLNIPAQLTVIPSLFDSTKANKNNTNLITKLKLIVRSKLIYSFLFMGVILLLAGIVIGNFTQSNNSIPVQVSPINIVSSLEIEQPILEFLGTRKFNKLEDIITIKDPGKNELNLGESSFSIGAWIKTSEPFGTIIDKRDMHDSVTGYLLMVYKNRLLFQVAASETGWNNFFDVDSINISDDRWHHVSATVDRLYNRTEIILYVDGQSVMSVDNKNQVGSLNNNADLLIGGHQEGGYLFNGSIGHLSVYKSIVEPQLNNKEIYMD